VMKFRRGTLTQFHDAFTVRHASTGLQIHGTDGTLIAEDVMTQKPIGQVSLRRGNQVEAIALGEYEDLYTRAVRLFNQAVHGEGEPSATGEDGVRSLAVALAVLESAKTGRRVRVQYQ